MYKLNILIFYATYSGNTKEVAELIDSELRSRGHSTTLFEIRESSVVPDMESYDLIFFGTFTWDYGYTPDFVKEFIADIGYKPEFVATFGTGDTQFGGEEVYCQAVRRIHKFYNSPWDPLFVEQSPRGSQERKVIEWTKNLLDSDITKIINKGKSKNKKIQYSN